MALSDARLFHVSGITFGLTLHSGYERNYNLEAFEEAMAANTLSTSLSQSRR